MRSELIAGGIRHDCAGVPLCRKCLDRPSMTPNSFHLGIAGASARNTEDTRKLTKPARAIGFPLQSLFLGSIIVIIRHSGFEVKIF